MDNSSNDPQARNTAHEALETIDAALKNPGVQEELAKQGLQIDVAAVEAALADTAALEPSAQPAVDAPALTLSNLHAAEDALSAANAVPFAHGPQDVPDPAPSSEPQAQSPVPDHLFSSVPTPDDPTSQKCNVPGRAFTDFAHPSPAPELEPWAQNPAAKAPDAQASLEDRVAALENSVAQMRDIMLHHGLRGPQL